MSQGVITVDELRELFGDDLPIAAAKILFPERFRDGVESTKTIDEVRAELRALAERMGRELERDFFAPPKPLKFIGKPIKISVLRLLWHRITRRPLGMWFHIDVVIQPERPFEIDRVDLRMAGARRKAEWDEGYQLTSEPRRVA